MCSHATPLTLLMCVLFRSCLPRDLTMSAHDAADPRAISSGSVSSARASLIQSGFAPQTAQAHAPPSMAQLRSARAAREATEAQATNESPVGNSSTPSSFPSTQARAKPFAARKARTLTKPAFSSGLESNAEVEATAAVADASPVAVAAPDHWEEIAMATRGPSVDNLFETDSASVAFSPDPSSSPDSASALLAVDSDAMNHFDENPFLNPSASVLPEVGDGGSSLVPVVAPSSLGRLWDRFRVGCTSRNFTVLCMCWVFASTGLVVSILGPTLSNLAEQTGSSFHSVVLLFTFRSVGFFIGGLLGPMLAEHPAIVPFPRLAILVPFLLELIATFCVPFCGNVVLLWVVLLLQGIGIACAENVCKMVLLRLLDHNAEKAAPLMNLLFAAFGIGGVIAPLYVAAFVPDTAVAGDASHLASTGDQSLQGPQADTQYKLAFLLVCSTLAPNAMVLTVLAWKGEILVLWRRVRGIPEPPTSAQIASREFRGGQDAIHPESPPVAAAKAKEPSLSLLASIRALSLPVLFVALAVTLIIFLYLGVEAWGSFLATLAQSSFGLSPSVASTLSSAFWLTFTAGRLMGVPLSKKLSPVQYLSMDVCGMLVSLLLLLIASRSPALLWVSSMVYGLFVGSIYANSLNWFALHWKLSGPVIAMTSVGDAAGAAFLPILIGATVTDPADLVAGQPLPSAVPCVLLFVGMTLALGGVVAALQFRLIPKARQHEAAMIAAAEINAGVEA